MRRPTWHLVVAVAALAAAAGSAAALLRQGRDVDEPIVSVALAGRVHARVLLPAGYDDVPHRRYPVVYFLHGLPSGASAYRSNAWLADALAAAGPAILVLPQGARDNDTDPEYLDWGAGRNWQTYIARELPRAIDARFRTIRSRAGRAIVGLSAGGYGATVVGLRHTGTFSVIESWSGYFHPTDPTGTKPLDRGPQANAHKLIGALRGGRSYFAFYTGRGDLRFRNENIVLDRQLTAAKLPHLFELYRGAHQTSLWQAHARGWLALALAHLAHPTS
jgi:S-formylglutathione hydrolase FrmB